MVLMQKYPLVLRDDGLKDGLKALLPVKEGFLCCRPERASCCWSANGTR
jgi:hypothetical protein